MGLFFIIQKLIHHLEYLLYTTSATGSGHHENYPSLAQVAIVVRFSFIAVNFFVDGRSK
jgi:hypothetical protein